MEVALRWDGPHGEECGQQHHGLHAPFCTAYLKTVKRCTSVLERPVGAESAVQHHDQRGQPARPREAGKQLLVVVVAADGFRNGGKSLETVSTENQQRLVGCRTIRDETASLVCLTSLTTEAGQTVDRLKAPTASSRPVDRMAA